MVNAASRIEALLEEADGLRIGRCGPYIDARFYAGVEYRIGSASPLPYGYGDTIEEALFELAELIEKQAQA